MKTTVDTKTQFKALAKVSQSIICLCVMLSGLASNSAFARDQGVIEVSAFAGWTFPSDYSLAKLQAGPAFGASAGYWVLPFLSVEGSYRKVLSKFDTGEATDIDSFQLSGLYHFLPRSPVKPFVRAGWGVQNVKLANQANLKDPFELHLGLGALWVLGQNQKMAFRFLVDYTTAKFDVPVNIRQHNVSAGLRFSVFFGKSTEQRKVDRKWEDEKPKRGRRSRRAKNRVSVERSNTTPASTKAVEENQEKVDAWEAKERARLLKELEAQERAAAQARAAEEAPPKPVPTPTPVPEAPGSDAEETPPPLLEKEDQTEGDEQVKRRISETVLEGVGFGTGNAVLTGDAMRVLVKVAHMLERFPGTNIEIQGHTDSSGSLQKNFDLSEARANAVRNYLIEQGVDPNRIKARGFGPMVPIADNATKEGRSANRRVEVRFLEE